MWHFVYYLKYNVVSSNRSFKKVSQTNLIEWDDPFEYNKFNFKKESFIGL